MGFINLKFIIMPTALDYGRRISIDDANKIVTHHNFLNNIIEKKLRKETLSEELERFIDRDTNAFVFDLELIQKFIKEGEDKGAKYMTVLLGAHPNNLDETNEIPLDLRENYKLGSFTVVLTLCEEIGESGVIETVSIKDPAIQYPPKKPTLLLVQNDPGSGIPSGQESIRMVFNT